MVTERSISENTMWAYRAVFTQANVGGGNVIVDITIHSRLLLLYGEIQISAVAGNRDVNAYILDYANGMLGWLVFTRSMASSDRIPLIQPAGAAAPVDEQAISPADTVLIGSTDKIRVQALALAQNETLDIRIRGLTSAKKPVVVSTASSGTVTVVTEYDKFI